MSARNGHHHNAEAAKSIESIESIEAAEAPEELGVVVRGSLTEGLEMRLAEGQSVEDLRAGKFVVVEGEKYQFFAMLSDVQLSASHPDVLNHPPAREDRLTRAVLAGTSTFGTVKLRPMLMVPRNAAPDDEDSLLPVKTVPAHFSPVSPASREDVGRVFGDEKRDAKFFHVGEPLDMDTPVCLNLERWIERSNAIFGKSGTGKTFLTRLFLCGVLKADRAVNLIFDMHGEYGYQGTNEGGDRKPVWGLKRYFSNRVQIFTLDPDSTQRKGLRADFTVQIPYSQIKVDDIALLQRELNLNAAAVETCYVLVRQLGESAWFRELLAMDTDAMQEFVESNNVHHGALAALQRKLSALQAQCRSFLVPAVPGDDNAVDHILECLHRGVSVVLEFGQQNRPLQYMLVANILTRHLHEKYVKMTEEAMGDPAAAPRPLVITIEEAHKFLSPHLAEQTIFGTIAREMRKYNVTLLIVDQRPSGIDDEVLSQVGTKVCCLLDDEKDIDAVLTGVSGANSLRTVLAGLETRQQALLFGHAVPMPVVVRTRQYDDRKFREALSPNRAEQEDTPEARALRSSRFTRDRDQDFP